MEGKYAETTPTAAASAGQVVPPAAVPRKRALWEDVLNFMLTHFPRPACDFERSLTEFYRSHDHPDPKKAARLTIVSRGGLGAIRMADHIQQSIMHPESLGTNVIVPHQDVWNSKRQ